MINSGQLHNLSLNVYCKPNIRIHEALTNLFVPMCLGLNLSIYLIQAVISLDLLANFICKLI